VRYVLPKNNLLAEMLQPVYADECGGKKEVELGLADLL
jgi:hypothetical protein